MRTVLRSLWLVIGVALWCCNCGDNWQAGDSTPKENQGRALEIVWNEVYERTDVPPQIVWTEECWFEGEKRYCGFTYQGVHEFVVSRWNGSFSASTFAHELCHMKVMRDTGDVDENHESDCFNGSKWNNGAEGSLVREAFERLQAEGL